MARHLDKDPATYTKERDGFVRDLHHFHDTRGTPFRRPPIIGGHEVDLFLLYSLVTQNGGWMKVNSKNGWHELLEKFDLPNKCVNGGIALKQIYIRFLDRYEKFHFLGEEADRGSDDDDESRHKRWSARALHSVSLNYNYHQHNIAEASRAYNGLSTTLHKQSDYDRLALSLISPLPNEQDFAVNVCTLMCNEGKHTLRLDKCPRLIDYLLAHTGVFNHVSLRTVFTEVYTTVRKHPLNHFWYDVVESKDFLDLINENNFSDEKKKSSKPISPPSKWRTKNNNNKIIINGKEETKTGFVNEENRTEDDSSGVNVNVELKSQSTNESGDKQNRIVISDDGSDSELFASETPVKLKLDVEDKYLFCTGSSLGTQDFVGQRVLQIANILRNLSFTEDNVTVLATNRTFLRFLLLCVSSRWNSIHQLGLDMLGNIAAEIILKDHSERLTDYLIKFVTDGLHSPDRVIILACLEILNKLSQREANEDFMLRVLEKKCYSQVCSFLTLHDVMLLIYTLECLYSLSSLGERACNFIVEVHGIIDTLVSLVTVEGKSYGPKACIGMKLVETVPGITTSQPTQIQQVSTPQQQHQQQNTLMPVLQQQPLLIATSSSSTVHITTTPVRPAPPIQARNISVAQHKHTTPTHTTPMKQTPASAQSSTPSSAQHVLQQQHAHQQAIQENEQFALAWLRATYEPCGHGRIEQQELYKQYLNSCTKIGRRGVIAPLHFPRCVRSVFGGTVGPNLVKNTDPPNNNLLFYEGIRPRIVPLIITLPSAALQQTVQHTKATAAAQRRKPPAVPIVAPVVTVVDAVNPENQIPNSPASPILKAQLSAPPKQRESPTKPDNKSQVLAHPHLSQALLGTVTNTSPAKDTSSTATSCSTASTSSGAGLATSSAGQSSSSSLIKSLLATKVNDCMLTPHAASSIKPPAAAAALPATDAIVQVAQRQQRLLAQQNQPAQQITPTTIVTPQKKIEIKPKNIRMNGIRLSDAESSLGSDTVSSTSSQHAENHYQPPPAAVVSGIGTNSTLRGRREPPQPPPPPLAPLSTSVRAKTPRMDIEDSNSTGNNSVAVSSTEDGDNSLTSFEGILLNGIPHSVDIDAPYAEDSNSKDSIKNIKSKPLMLADLLEKKVEKDPPILNGMLCKELRIGEKGLELVDNHINKVLSKDNSNNISELLDKSTSSVNNNSDDLKIGGVKRSAEDDISEVETKKLNTGITDSVAPNSVNGVDSPKPESIDSNGDDPNNASVSATAANLYASLAADVLEDEDEELLMQQEETPVVSTMPIIVDEATQHIQQTQQQLQVVQGTPMHQVIVTPHGQGEQLIMAQRQIIVSQGQIQPSTQQLLFTTGGQFTTQTTATIKTPTGHQTVLVQTPTTSSNNQQQRPQQMVISQAGGPPIHLVQHGGQMQQVQLVQTGGTGQPQTVMIQTPGTGIGNANQTQYVIAAQQQTALVQGQPQTVLVAQTPQQHGTPTKTIIILQSQPQVSNTATHHQKVVVTPQGQPVVVTQVQRPILQSSSVSNNIPPGMMMTNAQVIQTTANAVQKPTQATVITQNLNVTSPPSTPKSMGKPGSRPQTPIADGQTANGNKTTPTGQTSPLPPPLPPPPIIKDINHPWVCEWRGCTSTRKFRSANEVYMHACEIHCSPTLNPGDELQCLWDRCDTLKRKRFSLMTHLHDRHCSPDIMKAMAIRRRQLSQAGKTEISTPAPPPPHPGYAPDAALHAIKRHALEFVNPKELQKNQVRPGVPTVTVRPGAPVPEQDDNEGPVTKSIRLTASLILRNLVIFSNSSRRYLRHYEPHLAGVALSNVESSRTIAQLLYDLSDTSASRR